MKPAVKPKNKLKVNSLGSDSMWLKLSDGRFSLTTAEEPKDWRGVEE